jgi:hypothetical protein
MHTYMHQRIYSHFIYAEVGGCKDAARTHNVGKHKHTYTHHGLHALRAATPCSQQIRLVLPSFCVQRTCIPICQHVSCPGLECSNDLLSLLEPLHVRLHAPLVANQTRAIRPVSQGWSAEELRPVCACVTCVAMALEDERSKWGHVCVCVCLSVRARLCLFVYVRAPMCVCVSTHSSAYRS